MSRPSLKTPAPDDDKAVIKCPNCDEESLVQITKTSWCCKVCSYSEER